MREVALNAALEAIVGQCLALIYGAGERLEIAVDIANEHLTEPIGFLQGMATANTCPFRGALGLETGVKSGKRSI
jgi:hypothetical protein